MDVGRGLAFAAAGFIAGTLISSGDGSTWGGTDSIWIVILPLFGFVLGLLSGFGDREPPEQQRTTPPAEKLGWPYDH